MASFKELLEGKVKEISRAARSTPDRKPIPWFRRGEVVGLLAKALEHKADQVILDGQMFDITYKPNGKAFVGPADKRFFVPCAHLDVKKFTEDYTELANAMKVTRLEQ